MHTQELINKSREHENLKLEYEPLNKAIQDHESNIIEQTSEIAKLEKEKEE